VKVSIGYKIESGPWGGGNRFVSDLKKALELKSHKVVFDLVGSDIDIILIINPRYRRNPNVTFGAGKILNYLIFRNPKAVVVHRINECDERKNTRGMNFKLRTINYLADHTVFIASWLMKLNVWRSESPHSVLLNGADQEIFFPFEGGGWDKKKPLRLVTHHWGGNRLKGFDVYELIDKLLDDSEWSAKIDFTYIGNLPEGYKFKNVNHIKPLNGKELADHIRENDVYLTASINEPAGFHHIEGACCGLPLLYRNSGALPEYCEGFGIEFDGASDIKEKLNIMMSNYDGLRKKMSKYPNTTNNRTPEFVKLFELLYSKKKQISVKRKLWRNPFILIINKFL
jgi:glycosyltransferase involved in cell wall biosynthesis